MNVEKNSKDYWDLRFEKDWETLAGPEQSRYFARLALDHFPDWFKHLGRQQRFRICDWGCAEGDGTAVLASEFGDEQLTGVDFSEKAILAAEQRYPQLRFKAEDWVAQKSTLGSFDVIFSSNTLEHFSDPYGVLQNISQYASKFVVLLIPYREDEQNRLPEHNYLFFTKNIPFLLPPDLLLLHAKAIDTRDAQPNYWYGQQILLIYARRSAIDSLGLLHLGDVEFASEQQENLVEELRGTVSNREWEIGEREKKIALLTSTLAEREELLAERDVQLIERDTHITNLTREINELRLSTSWRVTRPLRFARDFSRNPKQATYNLAKYTFGRLPLSLQQRLDKLAIFTVQKLKGLPPPAAVPARTIGRPGDLTWEQFRDTVLSKRDEYKGVFVQEMNIDWRVPLYQRPQHFVSAMGRLGYLAIYRTQNMVADDVEGFRCIDTNVWITNSAHTDEIENAVRSFYSTSYFLDIETLKNTNPKRRLVYEYVDHISPKIIGGEESIKQLFTLKEFAVNGGADFIIATSRKLEEEAVSLVGKENVLYIPNGADVRHYRDPIHLTAPVPDSLKTFRKHYSKIIGYFGAVAPWLWYGAVNELIRRRPDLGFVFIGPDYLHGLSKLYKGSNVLAMGTVDYNVLPAYARQFDVCFIPFEPGEIAHTTSPLKLFEYFALEKPVVVTSFMDECVAFPEVFHGNSIESLSEAMDRALAVKDDPSFKARLAQLADQNSWEERASRLAPVFEDLHGEQS